MIKLTMQREITPYNGCIPTMMIGGSTEDIRRFSMHRQHFKLRCHLVVNLTADRTDGYGIGSVRGVDD
jgi:hypothetical protein